MIQAILFDLDGVIVDTAHYHFLAWKRLAKEMLGFELTMQHNDQLKGVSRKKSLEIILSLAGIEKSTQEIEELSAIKNEWFLEFIDQMKEDEIFPGVKLILKEIHEAGLKVGLASSSRNAITVLSLLNLNHEFDTVVDGTMIKHAKPHPEIFLLAAERLHVSPASCLVIEDAAAGIEAAIQAGMKCIGVGSPDNLGKADLVLNKTSEFKLSLLSDI